MSERAIPDVWEVFEKQGIRRNNSWKRMMTEEERTVTELFSDLHLHARSYDLSGDQGDAAPNSRKNSSQRQTDDEYNDRNRSTAPAYGNGWENIEKHLSMKKTIRKKMMRDLQQAFIDSQDPPNQQWDQVQMASSYQKTGEPNLLEMLKANPTAPPKSSNMNNMNNVNSMNDNQVELTVTKKPGFWKKLTMRKNKR